MEIETILHNAVKAQRAENLKGSVQMTLGELVAYLEPIAQNQAPIIEKYGHEASVTFDFEYAYPTDFASWRGSYDEVALGFSFVGYGIEGYTTVKDFKPEAPRVSEFLAKVKATIGKEYTGWKGGEFVMGKNTPIWVANDGNSGDTGIVGVRNEEYSIILETAKCSY